MQNSLEVKCDKTNKIGYCSWNQPFETTFVTEAWTLGTQKVGKLEQGESQAVYLRSYRQLAGYKRHTEFAQNAPFQGNILLIDELLFTLGEVE